MDSDIELIENFLLAEDKSSALAKFPKNSKFSAFMSLYLRIEESNFLELLETCEDLDEGEKKRLRLWNCLNSIKSNPNSIKVIKKELMDTTRYPPPPEMRGKVKSCLSHKLAKEVGKVEYSKYAKDLKEFDKLTDEGKLKVGINEMSDEVFLAFSRIGIKAMIQPGFVERVANGLADQSKSNLTTWIKILTLDQLEQVEKIVPKLKFKKEFVLEKIKLQINFETMKDDEKYVELNKLYEYSKITKIPEFFSAVLISLIHLSTKLRIFEPKFLNEYFACHRSHPIYRENNGLNESLLNEFLALLPKAPSENELLSEYFNEILPTKDTYEEVLYAIKENDAKKIFAKAKILSGADLSLFKDFLTQGELIELERKVEISLLPNNPEVFRNGDDVKLSLKIKNVKDLTVRIIEINGKHFYLNPSPTLDFDGLSATEEKVYKYNEGSHVVHIETFEFPSLNKSGIFYVEFIGSGLRTVALIKRGSLKCLFKTTVAGQAVTLIDENNEIVTKGGVFLDNKYIDLDNKNYIILPYSQYTSEKQLILTNGEIYSRVSFIHLCADFNFSCPILLNEEQMIVGQAASIYIKPTLKLYDIICEKFMISSLEATITTTDLLGQSSSKHFPNLEYSSISTKLTFIVPPQLSQCSVEVKLSLLQNNSTKTLSYKKSFDLKNISLSKESILSLYPVGEERGIFIEARGKNGELWEDVEVKVSLLSKYLREPIECSLATDKKGRIFLGDLRHFKSFNAFVDNFRLDIDLTLLEPRQSFPKEVVLCEGDVFEFSVMAKMGNLEKSIVLTEMKGEGQGRVLRIRNEMITFNESKNSLKIENLEKGFYSLQFFRENSQIFIRVIDGVHLNLDYSISEDSVFNTRDQFSYFSINHIARVDSDLKLTLSGNYENSFVYVLYSNFLPRQDFNFELASGHLQGPKANFQFDSAKNKFFDSQRLGDEFSYVLNRKNMPKFIGNTLPRPRILMKRLEAGGTQDQFNDISHRNALYCDDYPCTMCPDFFQDFLTGGLKNSSHFSADFLKKPSFWMGFQIEGPEFLIPVDPEFSTMMVLVDNGTCLVSTSFFMGAVIKTRDLTVSDKFQSNKSYIEKNLSVAVLKGEEFLVKNCENNFEIIDSVGKLFDLLVEIHHANHLNDWKFLTHWLNLTENEKEEKIEKFFSFELNFFIFHKDREFFDRALKPFISCKLEKTLIDHYLLNESLEKYAKNYESLNLLEKSLFVLWLINQNSSQASAKMRSFQDRVRLLSSKEKSEVFSKVFQSFKASRPVTDSDMSRQIESADPVQFMQKMMIDLSQINREIQESLKIQNECLDFKSTSSKRQEFRSLCKTISDHDEKKKVSCKRLKKGEFAEFGKISESELKMAVKKNAYYEKMESTKKYGETGYFSKESSSFNGINQYLFWADVLTSRAENKPILSENVLFTPSNLMSLVAVLALVDLPLVASPHCFTSEGKSVKITAGSNIIVFYKDLVEETSLNTGKIISAHSYSKEGSSKSLSTLSKQILYKCNLVLTNVSADPAEIEVFTVIPEGSIPIFPFTSIKNHCLNLAGYSTTVVNYTFYFPYSGNFKFYPASISEQGKIIATALTSNPEVLENQRIDKIESFLDVVSSANDSEILEYILNKNLNSEVDLALIYYKLNEKDFWNQLIKILKEKGFYDHVVYGFSLYHEDVDISIEYLRNHEKAKDLFIDMLEESSSHVEFSPLVNARAYQLGTQKRITNPEILKEYKTMLKKLVYKKQLNVADKLRICQYMLYKDELQKAKALFDTLTDQVEFSKESLKQGTLQIQLDYLRAYFYPEESLGISSLYLNYPVISWRKKFTDLYQIVTEATAAYLPDTQIQIEDHPSLSFSVENSIIKLDYSCVESCLISFYPIDLEVIFSLNPELNESSLKFSLSKPMKTVKVELEKKGKKEVKIEDELARLNLVVEVEFAGYTKSCVVYSNDLKYLVFEQQGVVKVMDKEGRPRVGCYFKTFSKRLRGSTSFYKDGFSDIRGKFDYVSIANSDLKSIEKFMILISDEELGSVVITAKPPPQ